MKNYNLENYIRYKADVNKATKDLSIFNIQKYNREQMIKMFLPLVENISKKFSTSQQASGVMDILDLIQEGNLALIQSIDNLDLSKITQSDDPEKTIKSFLSKRIKGSIRRAININRGSIRIPEYKINEIRKSDNDPKMLEMFFNSVFLSIDENINNENEHENENFFSQIRDNSSEYNIDILNKFLLSNMVKYLGKGSKEYEVLRLSYGLDCEKCSAKEIAENINISFSSSHVRISEIKKQAIDKLSKNLDISQVVDFL